MRSAFTGIIAVLLLGSICLVPAVGDAAQVTLRVFQGTTLLNTCGPFGSTTAATTGAVTLPSCGAFQITPQFAGVSPQLVGLLQNSANQVIVRTTKVKNTSANTLRLQIDGNHTFLLPSGITVKNNRFYGITLNATFLDAAGSLFAATGDKIQKKGFYSYYVGQTQTTEDQIGGAVGTGGVTLSYTVGTSTSTNTIPSPGLSANENNGGARKCIDLVPQNNCTDNLEKVRTVVEVTVAPGDTVTIPNGDHTIAAGDPNDVQAILNAATPQLILVQNTPSTTVNPFDNGYMTIVLVCNTLFKCEDVDVSTLVFGPLNAQPVSASLKDVVGYNDTLHPDCDTVGGQEICEYPSGGPLPKDGIRDLVLKFRMPQTGLDCDTTGGTLTGNVDFLELGKMGVEFHATAGFAAASQQCPQ